MGSSIGKGSSNFLDTLPIQGTVHLVMLGLDSAGKTTALYRLKFDQYLNTVPTIGFNCEKVQGALGKSKGIQFLVWDVGGQEKLRPLWRSYTRCTDGILFVVDSVDTERMEEAKMELMKTAKCPENQGVPVLILANKQDLPGARDSNELEKLLGLNELAYSSFNSFSADGSEKMLNPSKNSQTSGSMESNFKSTVFENIELKTAEHFSPSSKPTIFPPSTDEVENKCETSYSHSNCKSLSTKLLSSFPASNSTSNSDSYLYKRWYIQPTCAITGDGLQEGLDALYNMILKRKKISKALKKKR